VTRRKKTKIMFVCLGNICRSPLAHAVFDHEAATRGAGDLFETESSGTAAYHEGEPADARMRETALAHGVRIDHRARHLKKADLDNYDLILAMDRANLAGILKLAANPQQREKIRLFRDFDGQAGPDAEVPDPYYGGPEGFEEVFRIADRTCAGLLDQLLNTAENESDK